uniref:Uncharacterized protein n=1 Tax=Schizaphis graminum TaxID=13262 RepID=A0A2S2NN27_SCHGA
MKRRNIKGPSLVPSIDLETINLNLSILLLNCSLSTSYFVRLIFSFIIGFDEWKENEEISMLTRYVRHKRSRVNQNKTITTIYYCHRSGVIRTKNTGKRTLKLVGSCKIGKIGKIL